MRYTHILSVITINLTTVLDKGKVYFLMKCVLCTSGIIHQGLSERELKERNTLVL